MTQLDKDKTKLKVSVKSKKEDEIFETWIGELRQKAKVVLSDVVSKNDDAGSVD
jgi:hypothetical protein